MTKRNLCQAAILVKRRKNYADLSLHSIRHLIKKLIYKMNTRKPLTILDKNQNNCIIIIMKNQYRQHLFKKIMLIKAMMNLMRQKKKMKKM
jgi:hypothetical protein